MKYIPFALSVACILSPCLAFASGAPAQQNDFTAGIVGYKACGNFPDKISFNEKPNYCMNTEGKSVVSIILNGKDIIGISDESLKATSLKLGDQDLSKTRTGKPSYKLGSFPKVAESGAFAIFDVEMETVPFGKLRQVRFQGSIDVLTSSNLVGAKQDVDSSKDFEVKMGPYIVTNKNKLDSSSLAGALGNMMTGSSDGLTVRVVGDLEALQSLKVREGDKEVKSSWSSWNDNVKSFSFEKPTQGNVTIDLQYWNNMKKKTVSLAF